MRPYIALVWDIHDTLESEAALRVKTTHKARAVGWHAALDRPGMFVSVGPRSALEIADEYCLTFSQGVVIGKLFETEYVTASGNDRSPPRSVRLDADTSARILTTRGDFLRDKYWGGYIAFLADSENDRHWVMRDPSGWLPCQATTLRGISVYFSRLADVESIEDFDLDVDDHFLMGSVLLPTMFSGKTAFSNVETVLPGQRIEHKGRARKHDFFWDPIEISNATEAPVANAPPHVSMRRIVGRCIGAWASCFDSIALQLSGGLDSSIVAACLSKAPTRPKVTCVNFFSDRETSDERLFAQEVARSLGFELLEIYCGDRGTFDLGSKGARTVIPSYIQSTPSAWHEAWLALSGRGARVNLRGDGGDELFYRDGCLPDAVDLMYRDSLDRRLWAVAMNDALIDRTSVWSSLYLAARHGMLRRPYDWKQLNQVRGAAVLSDEARAACADESFWHPLYRWTPHCSPGKVDQSHRFLKFTCRFYLGPPSTNELPNATPLFSQPLMDFALRTPLYVLRRGGRDRALARTAFAEEIPRNVFNRRYKGLSTEPTAHWVRERIEEVREILLDGYLVRQGVLRRAVLESILSKEAAYWTGSSADSLVSFLCIEAWVRNSGAHSRIAA